MSSRYVEMSDFVERTNPLNTSNYSNNTRTLYIWLIVITIVTFFIYLALNAFFVYLPISRIETKFDQTIEKLDDVADKVNRTAEKADKIIDNVEDFGKVVVDEFDKIKAGICTWLNSEGIDFPFCSETKVVNMTMMSTQPRKPTRSCR